MSVKKTDFLWILFHVSRKANFGGGLQKYSLKYYLFFWWKIILLWMEASNAQYSLFPTHGQKSVILRFNAFGGFHLLSQILFMNIEYYYKLILCNNLMYQITVEKRRKFLINKYYWHEINKNWHFAAPNIPG